MPRTKARGTTILLWIALFQAWAFGVNSALHYWQDAAGNALALLLTLFVRRYWTETKTAVHAVLRWRPE